MINEIKTIVQNYLDNAKLCDIMVGTVENGGIRVSGKIVIPDDLIVGNLKASIVIGDRVRLLRNHGGKHFYILEVML